MQKNVLGIFENRDAARKFSSWNLGKTDSIEPMPQEVLAKLMRDSKKMGASVKRLRNGTAVIQCNPPSKTVVLLQKDAPVYQVGITEEFKNYLERWGSALNAVCTETGIYNVREWAKSVAVGSKFFIATILPAEV